MYPSFFRSVPFIAHFRKLNYIFPFGVREMSNTISLLALQLIPRRKRKKKKNPYRTQDCASAIWLPGSVRRLI